MNKIDQLIAERIMNWTLESYNANTPALAIITCKDEQGESRGSFNPSTNMSDAWLVLDKLCVDNKWRAIIDHDHNEGMTQINFKNRMGSDVQLLGYRETATLAICDIALDSIGMKLDDIIGEIA